MGENIFLDKNWQNEHLRIVRHRAGHRYTPKLNVDLPISEIFDGISRTNKFYFSIRKELGKLKREFNYVNSKYENSDIENIYKTLKGEIDVLVKILNTIKAYDTKALPWKKINAQAQKAKILIWKFSESLRREKENSRKKKSQTKKNQNFQSHSAYESFDNILHHLFKTQEELNFFEELSTSKKAKLSNFPFSLLLGSAGTGKTHLLCDLLEGRVKDNSSAPMILFFGELFSQKKDPFDQMIRQIGLSISKNKFLRLLDNAGKSSGSRSIIAIDALNETRTKKYWKKFLKEMIKDISSFNNIALIVSVRTGFEDEVIANSLKRKLIEEMHRGFEFNEWEAVNKFFNEFKLPLPEIPLLLPEFQNPLFLLLFCKAFQDRKKKNTTKKAKQIFRGHEGATYIFESFVDSVSKKISKQFGLSVGPKKNIWDLVIEKIAAQMVSENTERVSEDQLISITKNSYPSIDHHEFIKELERNLLLVKIPRYKKEKNGYEGFDFRFPFQKFSDHLIGRYLFKNYESRYGKQNKNKNTAKEYFSKESKLGRYLSESWNRGIIEALSIQCPEHLKGCEFVEVAPYLQNSNLGDEAFIESLIWRKPSAFSKNLKNSLGYINTNIITKKYKHWDLLNAFLTVASIPEHPFNADFLHKHLFKFSLADRDSWWSIFLHYHYGEKGAVDRLVQWGWSDRDQKHISDNSIRLLAVALIWFLTTSNRFLRDKATKALVALLTNRLNVVLTLLQQFHKVNDPYILERLFAVGYGCTIRTPQDSEGLSNLAIWVYKKVFKNGTPYPHILYRDYARGIIEVALKNNAKIRLDRKKIYPPYKSEWPKRVPTKEFLKKRYYPEDLQRSNTEDRGLLSVWSSVMYGPGDLADFGNYVLNSAIDHWSGRKLNKDNESIKQTFEKFKNGLNKKQNELLNIATDQYYSENLLGTLLLRKLRLSGLENSIDKDAYFIEKKALERERTKRMLDFEKSLSTNKKNFFKEKIKSFLNDRGEISDPMRTFNFELAQRWVFNRVVKLGWKYDLHGKFDEDINYNQAARTEHKPERIGKKYQWIAFHELLALVSDNFEFKGESSGDEIERYEGPWQIGVRDIDPSCILKEFPNNKTGFLPNFCEFSYLKQYNDWNRGISDSQWLRNNNKLPNPKSIIDVQDEKGVSWVSLEGFIDWQEDTLPENEKYELPTRRLWYMLKSYIVKKEDEDKIFIWAKRQNYMGRWMPESHEFYRIFLGEFPWASAFIYHNTPYFHHEGWTDGRRMGKKFPAKIITTNDHYMSSGSEIDCSVEEAINIKLPSKHIIDGMKLFQKTMDGRFYDNKNDLVAFYPNVFDDTIVQNVFIRKDKLTKFLKVKGYSIFWTLLGEKQMIGGREDKKKLGRLEINGAYKFSKAGKIIGKKKGIYK